MRGCAVVVVVVNAAAAAENDNDYRALWAEWAILPLRVKPCLRSPLRSRSATSAPLVLSK